MIWEDLNENLIVPDLEAKSSDEVFEKLLEKLEELKKIADRMCRYKLNQLQLYVEHTYLFRDFSEMWRESQFLILINSM